MLERRFVSRASGPPASYGDIALAYDTARSKTVLFAYTSRLLDSNELWEWDGTGWTSRCVDERCPGVSPPAREEMGLAYDEVGHGALMFGGQHFSLFDTPDHVLCDTWLWDGTRWRLALACTAAAYPSESGPDAASPGPRSGALMSSFGPHGVALFGGASAKGDRSGYDDLWLWNNMHWQPLCEGACRSAERPGTAIEMGSAGFSTGVGSAAMTYDSARDVLVLFLPGAAGAQDVWEYDIARDAWARRCTNEACSASAPWARVLFGAAFDSDRAQSVMYGGVAASGGTILADISFWDGRAWSVQAAPARAALAMVYDRARGRMVIVGGSIADTTEY